MLTLPGHKVNTGCDRVVQTTSQSCAEVHYQRLAAKVLSPPQGQDPPNTGTLLPFVVSELGSLVVPKVIAIKFKISPLYTKKLLSV